MCDSCLWAAVGSPSLPWCWKMMDFAFCPAWTHALSFTFCLFTICSLLEEPGWHLQGDFFLQISAVNNVSAWADTGRLMGILPPSLFPPPRLSLARAIPEPGRMSPASCAWLGASGTACSASPLRFDLELCKPRACLKWKRVLFAQRKTGNVIIKRRHWGSKEKAHLS